MFMKGMWLITLVSKLMLLVKPGLDVEKPEIVWNCRRNRLDTVSLLTNRSNLKLKVLP